MILSNEIYTSQHFLELLTGRCFFLGCNDPKEIHDILQSCGIEDETEPLWDYPLSEVEHIVENNIPVVLVDVSTIDESIAGSSTICPEYRWFEVPEDHAEKFQFVG